MSQATLLPCPFCGSEPLIHSDGTAWVIRCNLATCGFRPMAAMWNKEHAIAAWNTRPPHLAVAALLAVEKLFATPGYYIGTREGADPLAIDATMLLIAQAVRAAKP